MVKRLGHTRPRSDGNREGKGIEPDQNFIAAFKQMRRNEDKQRRAASHAEVGLSIDPKYRISVEQYVPQCAATHRREAGEKAKSHNIELCPTDHERARESKDQHGGLIKKGKEGHAWRSARIGLAVAVHSSLSQSCAAHFYKAG